MLCAFDFDGTLADSHSIYYQAVQTYAKKQKLPIPLKEEMDLSFGNPNPSCIFKGWGNTSKEFIRHLLNVYDLTDDIICSEPLQMPVFDGIENILSDLYNKGVILTIVTSRTLKPVQAVLKAHNLSDHFKTIRSHEDTITRGHKGKPYPDKLNCVLKELNHLPAEAVMIGDTTMDIEMAKNAGVKGIGVSWGYHKEDALRSSGAHCIVHKTNELGNTLLSYFG